MTSSSNLLNLVSQLQSMEMSFTSILMETAMKLSALTDASIFVLVETADGRKISGKRHLCDAYMSGSLIPTGQDVEFEVNPLITALQERQAHLPETYTGSAVFPSASSVPLSASHHSSTSSPLATSTAARINNAASRLIDPLLPSVSRENGFPRKRPGDHLAFHSGVKQFRPIAPKRPATPRIDEEEMVSINIKEETDVDHNDGLEDRLEKEETILDDQSDEDIGIVSEFPGKNVTSMLVAQNA